MKKGLEDTMGKKMTSKQRVQETLGFGKADRVPFNISLNEGIENNLFRHFKVTRYEDLLKCLDVDFRGLGLLYTGKPLFEDNIEGVVVDRVNGIHRRWVEHGSGGYWDYCDFPLKDAEPEDIDAWPMPSPDDFDYDRIVNDMAANRDYGTYFGGAGWGDIMNSAGFLFGTERVYVGLALDDEALLKYIDRRIDLQVELTVRVMERIGRNLDFLWIGEDLGTQRGPLISLEMFREKIRPRHMRIIDVAKQYGLPIMIHCCGSSSWAFEDFIEMGITGVDTLQPEAKDMAPRYLKENFGNRLVFHGAISTAGPLAYGSREELMDCVKDTLEIYMPGGGYCLAPTHAIQDNSPTENVLAMYEAGEKYGYY